MGKPSPVQTRENGRKEEEIVKKKKRKTCCRNVERETFQDPDRERESRMEHRLLYQVLENIIIIIIIIIYHARELFRIVFRND
jgi:hypothetical protein